MEKFSSVSFKHLILLNAETESNTWKKLNDDLSSIYIFIYKFYALSNSFTYIVEYYFTYYTKYTQPYIITPATYLDFLHHNKHTVYVSSYGFAMAK